MQKYTVRAYEADGEFAFGATFISANVGLAYDRFSELPLAGRRAVLLYGRQEIAVREAEPERREAGRSG